MMVMVITKVNDDYTSTSHTPISVPIKTTDKKAKLHTNTIHTQYWPLVSRGFSFHSSYLPRWHTEIQSIYLNHTPTKNTDEQWEQIKTISDISKREKHGETVSSPPKYQNDTTQLPQPENKNTHYYYWPHWPLASLENTLYCVSIQNAISSSYFLVHLVCVAYLNTCFWPIEH